MKKRILIIIVALIVIFGVLMPMAARVSRILIRGTPESRTPAQYTKEEYLSVIVRSCARNDIDFMSYCRCFYSKAIDEVGVVKMYELDKLSVKDPTSPLPEIFSIFEESCRSEL